MTILSTYFINFVVAMVIAYYFFKSENGKYLRRILIYFFLALAWYQGLSSILLGLRYKEIIRIAGTRYGWVWWLQVIPLEVALIILLTYIMKKRTFDSEKAIRLEKEITIRDRLVTTFNSTVGDDIYAEVLDIILEMFESVSGIFGYVDKDNNFVCPSMTRNVWEKCQVADKTIVFSYSEWGGIWGRALKEKKVMYSNKPFNVPKGHIPIKRAMCMPIIFQKKLIGLLEIANKPFAYTMGDIGLVGVIANYLAPILNARLQKEGKI